MSQVETSEDVEEDGLADDNNIQQLYHSELGEDDDGDEILSDVDDDVHESRPS